MQLVWGLGGILVIAPYYLVYKKKKPRPRQKITTKKPDVRETAENE